MPEYLTPGVYIEEIELGAKPIEGVSTSTAGFVGMAEKGPLNKPTLVTSFAEYRRKFGGYLGEDYNDMRFLPYAVEGFFSNGGQRAYVTRVAGEAAKKAKGFIPNITGLKAKVTNNAAAGSKILEIDNATGLTKNDVLLLKSKPEELLTYIGPAKTLRIDRNLNQAIKEGEEVKKMNKGNTNCLLAKASKNGDKTIDLNDATGLNIDDFILISDEISRIEKIEGKEITLPALKKDHSQGDELYKLSYAGAGNEAKTILSVEAGLDVIPIDGIDKIFNANDYINVRDECFLIKSANSNNIILLAEELKFEHNKDEELVQLITAIDVKALNEGAWGNDIKIVVKNSSISKAKVMVKAEQGKNILTLDTVAGMEKGTIIDITGKQNCVSVEEVIKDGNRIRLKGDLPQDLKEGAEISTVEFDLEVTFRGYSEYYRNLSMGTEHSRYIEKVISDGSSGLITSLRVIDKMPIRATQNILKPNGEGSGWPLQGGEDGIPKDDNNTNAMYIGKDSEKPEERSGLYAMWNENGISIVAIPGIISPIVLSKLINHCEVMKDRFAVIDSEKGSDLDGIKSQKYLYDSKFTALYYPWIHIFDPHPKSSGQINAPPSGHVCGVYARTDAERGVHKAPANEIVRGALDLEEISPGFPRIITNGMQDILNPMGVNCIRSFPGRGIRIWGARTISSDASWKYINVERLFLFLEESIKHGTQWVVFEPNDEKLWSRVKQTIGQFLTDVWRSGALMGKTEEKAFFVKCDRTTMTQGDIDSGRLVVLVGVAPVKPAEFVIFRIAQVANAANVSE